MQTITKTSSYKPPDFLKEHFDLSRLLFFDIETTGFSAKTSSLYLIGCLYFEKGVPMIRQWFAETIQEESSLLFEFFDFMKNYDHLIHYNGSGFDIPYLMQKCAHYNLPYTFEEIESIDLYKILSPVKSMLKLENLKQKTVESYLDIQRDDLYNGGELISVYQNFLKSPSKEAMELLLLHNNMVPEYLDIVKSIRENVALPVIVSTYCTNGEAVAEMLNETNAESISLYNLQKMDIMEIKQHCREANIDVDLFESSMPFEAFKLN